MAMQISKVLDLDITSALFAKIIPRREHQKRFQKALVLLTIYLRNFGKNKLFWEMRGVLSKKLILPINHHH